MKVKRFHNLADVLGSLREGDLDTAFNQARWHLFGFYAVLVPFHYILTVMGKSPCVITRHMSPEEMMWTRVIVLGFPWFVAIAMTTAALRFPESRRWPLFAGVSGIFFSLLILGYRGSLSSLNHGNHEYYLHILDKLLLITIALMLIFQRRVKIWSLTLIPYIGYLVLFLIFTGTLACFSLGVYLSPDIQRRVCAIFVAGSLVKMGFVSFVFVMNPYAMVLYWLQFLRQWRQSEAVSSV